MQCKKCGNTLFDTDKFCKNCGEPVSEMNLQNFNTNNQQSNTQNIENISIGDNKGNSDINNQLFQNNSINNQPYQTNENDILSIQNDYQQVTQTSLNQEDNKNGKRRIIPKSLTIIGGIAVGIIVLFIVIFLTFSAISNKMICTSNEGNIKIMYNKNGLTGYKASGMTYQFDEQKEYAKQIGIDEYLKEFNTWFTTNTSGSCTINGKKVEQNSEPDDRNINNDTKVVGDEKYGYITIPSNWTKFYDTDGDDSLQYSYANAYIVTLDILDGQNSAKTYASNYMYNKQNSSEVTGVSGATITIGKNKEYTAYQVYMYYPSDSTYLVTYWFEAEDGKVHYIALEGPQELNGVKMTDYLYIAESFSLKK
jgi:hypothetical protein